MSQKDASIAKWWVPVPYTILFHLPLHRSITACPGSLEQSTYQVGRHTCLCHFALWQVRAEPTLQNINFPTHLPPNAMHLYELQEHV